MMILSVLVSKIGDNNIKRFKTKGVKKTIGEVR